MNDFEMFELVEEWIPESAAAGQATGLSKSMSLIA